MTEAEGDPRKQRLTDLTSNIVRAKQKGDLENLLATELAQATYSADPLQKLRHILESYLMLHENDRARVLPDPEERTLTLRLYMTTLGVLNIMPTHDSIRADRAMIPFAFPPDQAYLFLEECLTFSWDLTKYYRGNFDRSYFLDRDSCTRAQIQEYYSKLLQFLSSGEAPIGLCLTIKTLFITYALPKALRILREIYTLFISPELWSDVITSLGNRGQKAAI